MPRQTPDPRPSTARAAAGRNALQWWRPDRPAARARFRCATRPSASSALASPWPWNIRHGNTELKIFNITIDYLKYGQGLCINKKQTSHSFSATYGQEPRLAAGSDGRHLDSGGHVVEDLEARAASFVRRDDVGVLPVAGVDAVPRKCHVVAGRHTLDLEAAVRVRRSALVQVHAFAPGDVWQQRDGDVRHGLAILIQHHAFDRSRRRPDDDLERRGERSLE